MPSSLFAEIERGGGGGPGSGPGSLEEQRALQLAFELSMLGLDQGSNGNGTHNGSSAHTSNGSPDQDQLNSGPSSVFEEARSKKSQNMTECVPVPSSEHVAEIVGRQGCKIKALRAKTNTYIKTPVRGEEPVFVVTGRKEDVARAKREILSAAEHFSQIRASRKSSLGALLGTPPGPPANVPGHITIQVRVPYRVVGLVVGPKGATIKRIQHQTHTYIVTPSRDKEPVFEVTGLPESVAAARTEIQAHITQRTGVLPLCSNDEKDLLEALCRGGLGSILGCLEQQQGTNGTASVNGSASPTPLSGLTGMTNGSANNGMISIDNKGTSTGSTSSGAFSSSGSCSSSSSSTSSGIGGNSGLNDLVAIWGSNSLERDEGLGDSPSFDGHLQHHNSGSNSVNSVTGQSSTTGTSTSIWSFPGVQLPQRPSPPISTSPQLQSTSPTGLGSLSTSSASSTNGVLNINVDDLNAVKECVLCGDKDVSTALVPCGHKHFCVECGNRICMNLEPTCPVCFKPVLQALRIII